MACELPFDFQSPKKGIHLVPILLIFLSVAILTFAFVLFETSESNSRTSFYLLPWSFLTGVVVLAPTAYLLYKKKFDPFHPLVFAAWSYVFPAFVLGGVIISFGLVDPYFMSFIERPEYNLPLSLVYVAIGFLGLTAGFATPIGGYFAKMLESRLPKWQWKPSQVWLPGILLFVVGISLNIVGFVQGIVGYQSVTESGVFDGLLYFLLVLLSESTILLWLNIFSVKEKSRSFYLVLFIQILFLPFRLVLIGGRSSLLISMFPIAMAFQYSGRRLKWQYAVGFIFMFGLAVCIGVTYGTTFRNIKGSEDRTSVGNYVENIGATLDYLSREDPSILINDSAQSLANRIENLSSLAVVVANYEQLEPYEASYGIKDNILNDALTALIPRFFWNDKPTTSDARAYSDLYFNYGNNSFAISPFGDLLRNFGPVGVPVGMFVLGIYLRSIYAILIDTPYPAMWKKVAYFPLLMVVSYESFYATILPSVIRISIVLAISLFLINLIASRLGRSATAAS